MSFSNAGKSWGRQQLHAYLATLKRPAWAKGITFHHTAEPALDFPAWAKGWNAQLIDNMRVGYQRERGWNRGPHFYPDDHAVWGLTPPTEKGIHAIRYNGSHIGIEVLGDYDRESPNSGRGFQCWTNAFWCAAEVLHWLGLVADNTTVTFHREDPKTSKTCPGKLISKDWAIRGVGKAMFFSATETPVPISEGRRVSISHWLELNGRTAKIVRTKDGHVLVGGAWIESAQYDKALEVTTALVSELETDVPK